MGALDPNAYVEPMELYDSIFWGKLVLWSEGSLGRKLTCALKNHPILGTQA